MKSGHKKVRDICLPVRISFNYVYAALVWATCYPGHHVAARSYQIYRTLKASMSLEALGDILHSLGMCLALPSPESIFNVVVETKTSFTP